MQDFGQDVLVQAVSLAHLTFGTIAVYGMFEMTLRHTGQNFYTRKTIG